MNQEALKETIPNKLVRYVGTVLVIPIILLIDVYDFYLAMKRILRDRDGK